MPGFRGTIYPEIPCMLSSPRSKSVSRSRLPASSLCAPARVGLINTRARVSTLTDPCFEIKAVQVTSRIKTCGTRFTDPWDIIKSMTEVSVSSIFISRRNGSVGHGELSTENTATGASEEQTYR